VSKGKRNVVALEILGVVGLALLFAFALALFGALGRTPRAAAAPNAALAAGPKAYAGIFKDNTVAVLDTATNAVIGKIPVPAGPHGIVATPDGRRVYVSSDQVLSGEGTGVAPVKAYASGPVTRLRKPGVSTAMSAAKPTVAKLAKYVPFAHGRSIQATFPETMTSMASSSDGLICRLCAKLFPVPAGMIPRIDSVCARTSTAADWLPSPPQTMTISECERTAALTQSRSASRFGTTCVCAIF